MKSERRKVDFPLWRKKVDGSLFEHLGTTIPAWAVAMWEIRRLFLKCTTKSDPDAQVRIRFEKRTYKGYVVARKKGRKTPNYRLFFREDLGTRLKEIFLMSYMRTLENALSEKDQGEIEERIPFWEFLDIEFDPAQKVFLLTAHYRQEPAFPELFRRLIGSPRLQQVGDEIAGKAEAQIHKQDWKPKAELEYELGAQNVIYTLIDSDSKLLYVGEANSLTSRLSAHYPSIPKWNHFRYDVLPKELEPFRVQIERMLIRHMASLLKNKKGINSQDISDYHLANDKIDS